jgi:hypothetical protein
MPCERKGLSSAPARYAKAGSLDRLQRLLAWIVQMTAKAPHFAFRAGCKPPPWHALHALLERNGLAA